MAKKQNSVPKRVKLDRISLAIWHGRTMPGDPVQNALASGLSVPEVRPSWILRDSQPQGLPMLQMSCPDLTDPGDHLCRHQTPHEALAYGHLSGHTGKGRLSLRSIWPGPSESPPMPPCE